MSTTVSTHPAAGGAAEMRRRGRLVLADRVVEKIAGQAAAEVVATAGRSGGFLGIGSDTDTSARPKVDVTLSAESADLSLAVGIAYPGSIRRATQEVRDHVTERVETLTGVDVRRVDIDVTFLALSEGPTKKALR
ncbi:MAG: Asp23/Gls24 family envelope stress response protein [Janthinobacterium lividum]